MGNDLTIQCPNCKGKNCIKDGKRYNRQRYRCKDCRTYFRDNDTPIDPDKEIIIENVRLAKQRQKLMDSNRIERKSFREYARVENAITEYNNELISLLKNYSLSRQTKSHKQLSSSQAVGIIHFTDPHFNELVSLSINRYDFTIASKRCYKYIQRARQYFKSFGIRNVLFAMTGDLLNSDRRLDEQLSEATNRSKATFIAVEILSQMLLDLNRDFNLTIASVSGNESRITKDLGWTEIIATDNYDFTIHNILSYLFKNSNGITFVPFGDNPNELIVNVGSQNILLCHGNSLESKTEESVQKVRGKYAAQNISVDFVLFGHLHSCRIGDTYARGSSVVGANAYSDSGLQLASQASQNIHIIFNRTDRDSIRIGLQDVSDITDGYDITNELEAYNAKSSNRLKKSTTIIEVRI